MSTLSAVLEQACRRFGTAVAVRGGPIRLTYTELAESAHAVASLLRAAGLETNEPVHVQVSNQPQDVVALFGLWLAGGVAVPVHRNTPAAVAAMCRERSQARFVLDLESCRAEATSLSLMTTDRPPQRPLLEGAAIIVFTSGSTGAPKGVVVAHEAFTEKIGQIDTLLGFGCDDRTLLVLNITFSFGLWLSLLTLLRGGTLVMAPKFEPEAFLRVLCDERITHVGMVPTMMRVLFSDRRHDALIDHVTGQGDLRQILIGGESLGPSLAQTIRRRFTGADLIDIYGLTETATCDFFSFPADYARYPGSIGRPSPNVRYRITDAQGHAVAAGAVGELQIRSPYLMRGYLDAPELTSAAYQDGWFKTGDLGRDVDGQVVELMGRQKEVISRGGNKVTPAEIEQSICSHPDVAAALAVGIADAVLGERIHLLVVARAGTQLEVDALRQHLATRLERYKHPDTFYFAPALPLGRTGKADRAQFKALVLSAELTPAPP